MAEIFRQDEPDTELEAEHHWIWRAWERLTDERNWQTRGVGMPMGATIITPFPCRIPWTAVALWADAHSYDDDERAMLDECLLAMDAVFIAWWVETQTPKR